MDSSVSSSPVGDKFKGMARLLIVVAVLATVPFLLRRESPGAKAAERIRNAVAVAEGPVHKPGSGNPDAEKFLLDLKAVDQSGCFSKPESSSSKLRQRGGIQ